METIMNADSGNIYTDGTYSSQHGGMWHLEDSPHKARWIMRMLARHPHFQPKKICEIGCGAGGILAELRKIMPEDIELTGYEISPQADAMSRQHFGDLNIRFILGTAFDDPYSYDLAL